MIKKFFTLLCLCTLCIGSAWGETYTKTNSIKVGDQVVFVCETAGKELTGISTTSTKYGIGSDFTSSVAATYVLDVVAGSETGSFSFKTGSNYLRWNSGNSLDALATSVAKSSSWVVNFDGDGNATIKNANDETRIVMWNKSSPRFACYAGQSVGDSYYAIQLYKKEAAPTVAYKVTLGDTNKDIVEDEPGSGVQLPIRDDVGDYTFVGWCTEKLTIETATSPTIIPTGLYKLKSNMVLYPVYTKIVEGEESWNVANSIEAGDIVVISTSTDKTTASMRTAGTISSNLFSCIATSTFSEKNTKITSLGENTLQFTIEGNATTGWAFRNGDNYLKMSGDKKVALSPDIAYWTVSFDGNKAQITQSYSSKDYSIQYNYNTGNDRFTGYTSKQDPISLFKRTTSVTHYCPPPMISATITTKGYATFSSDYALDLANLPEGLTAYQAEEVGDNAIKMTEVTTAVKANTGLFLAGTANNSYAIPVAVSGATLTDNLLVATDGSEVAAGSYVYVIARNAFSPLANATTVSKGKAYIAASVGAKGDLEVIFGEPTGIEQVNNIKSESNKMYNLQGVQVNKNYNGVVIMNGKKYLNK